MQDSIKLEQYLRDRLEPIISPLTTMYSTLPSKMTILSKRYPGVEEHIDDFENKLLRSIVVKPVSEYATAEAIAQATKPTIKVIGAKSHEVFIPQPDNSDLDASYILMRGLNEKREE